MSHGGDIGEEGRGGKFLIRGGLSGFGKGQDKGREGALNALAICLAQRHEPQGDRGEVGCKGMQISRCDAFRGETFEMGCVA